MRRTILWLPLGLFLLFVIVVIVQLRHGSDTTIRSQMIGKAMPEFALQPIVPGHGGLSLADRGRAGLLRFTRNDGIMLALLVLIAAPAFAQSRLPPARYSYPQLENPQQEAKAKALMETLRCLVCQGQSIADSDAEMAGDMRAMVRERIRQGEAPEQVRAWLIERYGAYVSYRPPVEPLTWPL